MACNCSRKCPKCHRDILRVGREIAPLDGRPAIRCTCGTVRLAAIPPEHKTATWITQGLPRPVSQPGRW